MLGFLACAFSASAQELSGAQELRELRQAVQLQSKQIELLTEQIARLTRVLETQKAPEPGFQLPATTSIEPPTPAAVAPPAPANVENAPKAEAVGGGTRHVVAKGETLTFIAKQYNIPIVELKNANKIENERKLQIGQVLTIPAPKSPETSEKKDNP